MHKLTLTRCMTICCAIFIFYQFCLPANAAVRTANTCSQSDVTSAISSAVNGDKVSVPAGSCAWSSQIRVNKEIAIIGSGIDQTIITGNGFIVSDGTNNWRISGFTFSDTIGSTRYAVQSGNLYSNNGCRDFRIDNNKIYGYTYALFLTGYTRGVVDHNQISYGMVWLGGNNNTAWASDTNLGGNDFLFVEDNTFIAVSGTPLHTMTGKEGSRYVFRYNIINDTSSSSYWPDPVDVHGYCHGTADRGGRAFEIYNNTFNRQHDGCCRALYLRGGTGVVHGNIFNEARGQYYHDSHSPIYLHESRLMEGTGQSSCPSACSTAAWCSTSQGGEGYPCCDQIGRGKNQALEPVYIWNNKDHNGNTSPVYVNTNAASFIVLNRDFYLSPKSGYTAYTYPHPLVRNPPPGGDGLSPPFNLRLVD